MKKNRKKFKIVLLFTLFAVLITYIVIGFSQKKLVVTEYVYHNKKLPKAFDGYKIVLISDLHHKNFGDKQSELLEAIKKSEPDLILFTGDIVDKNHDDMTPVENLLKGISGIAPAYYVTGNHELDMGAREQYVKLELLLEKYGVTDLDNLSVEIKRGEDSIFLHGKKYLSKNIDKYLETANQEYFNILMYHCSDSFGRISGHGYDIVMSGHTHGGIVRLPIVGGVIGNSRELFPKYDGGVFIENNCTLFSSKGLGDAEVPRFYNPPEVVVVTLKCE